MKRNDLLTPEGTRDLLFEECAAKRTITGRLTEIFESYGYTEVITPGLEFYDVFNGKARHFPQETLYKLVDGKNRLMVLRPDNTLPIARLVATRLRSEELPLKLFYNQSIFMVNPKDSGRDDEFSQSGIEIIGGKNADYEALFLAGKALAACDEDYRLEIGESGIFRELISDLGTKSEDEEDLIRSFVETKNYPALNEALKDYDNSAAKAIAVLPKLFGGMEVFDEARKYFEKDSVIEKLNNLEALCRNLISAGLGDKLRVDLGLVHKKNYYTGIIFRGYVEGYGQPALSGGRYDNLLGDFGREAPAVGFAVNVEAAAKVFLRKNKGTLSKTADVLVFGGEGAEVAALKHCDEIIGEGLSVYNFLGACPKCAEKYAKEHGIHRVEIVSKDGTIERKEV